MTRAGASGFHTEIIKHKISAEYKHISDHKHSATGVESIIYKCFLSL